MTNKEEYFGAISYERISGKSGIPITLFGEHEKALYEKALIEQSEKIKSRVWNGRPTPRSELVMTVN